MKSHLKSFFICLIVLLMVGSSLGLASAENTRTWAMAGGTADRQRRSIARVEPPLIPAWNTGGEGSIWGVRPVLSSKYAYLGFAKLVSQKPLEYDRWIEKRDLETGDLIWDYDKAWNIWGTYQGDIIVQGFDDDFSAWYRRIDGGDRHTVWNHTWNDRTVRKTSIDGDVIYTSSFMDSKDENGEDIKIHYLHAFSAVNGKMLWRKNYKDTTCVDLGFCIWEDALYYSVGLKFYKLSKSNGGEIWSIDIPEKLPKNIFITADEEGVFYVDINDKLIKRSHEDGSELWNMQLSSYQKEEKDDTPSSSPGIMDGKVYVQSRGNHHQGEPKYMYCLDAKTGQMVWETMLEGTSFLENFDIGHAVTCTKYAVYCMAEAPGIKDTQITAFDPETGRIIWKDTTKGIPYQDELAVTTSYLVASFAEYSDISEPIYEHRCWTNKGVDKPELETESEELSFGEIDGDTKVTKKLKIWSGTDTEIVGTVESSEGWLTVSPSSFSGNEVNISLTANPSQMTEGINQATLSIKSNGGDKDISVTAIYGKGSLLEEKTFNFDINCTNFDDWKEIIRLEGFQKGSVDVDVPWLIVEPSIIMGTDIDVVFKLNETQVNDTNRSAEVIIETGNVKYTCIINITKMPITRNINMWISNKEALVNGEKQTVDPPPQILEGRTMLPLRFTGEALGIEFTWIAETRSVEYFTFNGEKVVLGIGNKVAKIGEREVTVDPPAQILEGRTMVPVRFISESLGAEVSWDGDERKVTVDLEICQ